MMRYGFSYLVGVISGDLQVAANQNLTRKWWANRANGFCLFVSQLVVAEV